MNMTHVEVDEEPPFPAAPPHTRWHMHMQNATLAGGVAVGTVAAMMIQPWGAALVGTEPHRSGA